MKFTSQKTGGRAAAEMRLRSNETGIPRRICDFRLNRLPFVVSMKVVPICIFELTHFLILLFETGTNFMGNPMYLYHCRGTLHLTIKVHRLGSPVPGVFLRLLER